MTTMNAPLHTTLARVTQRITDRSSDLRGQYLHTVETSAKAGT